MEYKVVKREAYLEYVSGELVSLHIFRYPRVPYWDPYVSIWSSGPPGFIMSQHLEIFLANTCRIQRLTLSSMGDFTDQKKSSGKSQEFSSMGCLYIF